ncbi:MAG TPA: single-stranded DNA-binding protein [Edaphocola sp.]|nr:single-stranded DNA-binding protein [Edaphocola sp.]
MNTLKNKVQLIGHLGADPEVKNFDSGRKQVTMRVATSERYQVSGEWKEDTQWHRVITWSRTADRAEQYLKKGSFILAEGKLIYRNYEDANGQKHFVAEVQLYNFILLDKKNSGSLPKGENVDEHEEVLPF